MTRQVTDVIVAVTVMSSAVYRNMLLKANLAKSTNTVFHAGKWKSQKYNEQICDVNVMNFQQKLGSKQTYHMVHQPVSRGLAVFADA